MAQISSNSNTWISNPEAASSDTFDYCNIMHSDISTNHLEAALIWQQLDRSTGLHDPTSILFQPDVLGSGGDSRLYVDSGQIPEFLSDDNGIYNYDLLDEIPEVSPLDHNVFSVINRNPNTTGSQPEDQVFPNLDPEVKAPGKRRGRRRASESGTCEGWVPSKNLISERRRREKLKEGLLSLRSLVPNITKMDKASILSDTINHLQDLKRKLEMLENLDSAVGDGDVDLKVGVANCDLEMSEAENESENQNNSSTGSGSCSARCDEVVRCDYQTRSSKLHQIQLDVIKLAHGMYKLDFTCNQQSGVLVHLSQAIEAFVIEIIFSNIVVISTKVACTFIVKMSSWNDMALEDVKVDITQLLGQSGLQVP